jgi:hypothetical protein
MCNPAISAHVTWRLLDDLCGSDHFPIFSSPQSSVLHKDRNPNWVVKQADWSLFSQLAIIEETPFSTEDSMVDKFTYTVIRVSEQSIPLSYAKPRRVPDPWWKVEYRDAIRARKRGLRNFPAEANDIAFKLFRDREQRTIRWSKRLCWEKVVSSMSSPTPSTVV